MILSCFFNMRILSTNSQRNSFTYANNQWFKEKLKVAVSTCFPHQIHLNIVKWLPIFHSYFHYVFKFIECFQVSCRKCNCASTCAYSWKTHSVFCVTVVIELHSDVEILLVTGENRLMSLACHPLHNFTCSHLFSFTVLKTGREGGLKFC